MLQRHTSSLRKSMLLLLFLLHFTSTFSQAEKNQTPANTIAYHLKKATALLQHNADSAFLYANKASKLITNETSNQEKSEVYLCLGNINSAQGNYASALKHYFNAKKLAEQEALRLIEVTKQKEEQLKQATIDKNIAIEKAKGESEALKIKGQSISSNPKIIELEWINKWNGQLPTYMMGNGQGIMVNLNNK